MDHVSLCWQGYFVVCVAANRVRVNFAKKIEKTLEYYK